MNYLIVVAHPDDEVLGIGGTIYNLIKMRNNVSICVLSAKAEARKNSKNGNDLISCFKNIMENLGISKIFLGKFPNIKMNTVAHLDLVQFIEKSIIESNADIVITHYPNDLNDDHKIVSNACCEAVRIFQRRNDIKPIKEFYFMEVLSSTDWNFTKAFQPNTFIEINEEGLNKKIELINSYDNVIRDFPHPRSKENIKSLAIYRGCQANLKYAEGLILVFRRID